MMRAVVVVLAFAAPAFAEDALPYVGVWTADQSWCVFADQIGSHTPAPVEITQTEILGYENTCQITSAQPVTLEATAWRIVSECQSEGSTYVEEEIVLIPSANEIWRFQGGAPFRLTRCEGVK